MNKNRYTELLRSKFGDKANHWSVISYGTERVFRDIVESCIREIPKDVSIFICEIGTHRGISAAILSDYITDKNPLETYDIIDWDYCSEILDYLKVTSKIRRYILGKKYPPSTKDINEGNVWLINKLIRRFFHIAFIDGNHSFKSVMENFVAVNSSMFIVFHDYSHNSAHENRTVRFVDSLGKDVIVKEPPFAVWRNPDVKF